MRAGAPEPAGSRTSPKPREGRAMPLHVDSEVGRLRQVILHRPDLELKLDKASYIVKARFA